MAKKSFYKIEMLFLKVLEQEDCYGYQLTQSIQDITNGQIKIAEGTMYPILYKLQDKGYLLPRPLPFRYTCTRHGWKTPNQSLLSFRACRKRISFSVNT